MVYRYWMLFLLVWFGVSEWGFAQSLETEKTPRIQQDGLYHPMPEVTQPIYDGDPTLNLPRIFWNRNPRAEKGGGPGSEVDDTRDMNAWDFEPAAPNLFRNWSGPNMSGMTPGDPVVTVGPERILAAINGRIVMYRKDGTVIQSVNPNTFYNHTDFLFDPRVAYDPWRDRFLIMYMRKSDSPRLSHWALAISKTGTPTLNSNDWWRYSFNANHDDHWADYGYLGFDQNAVYLTSYQIPHGLGFTDGQIYALNKDQIYSGASAGAWRVTNLTETHIAAAHMWSSAGTYMYFNAMHLSGSNRMYFFVMNWNDGGTWAQRWANGPSFSTHSITVPSYDVQPNARQPNNTQRLDTIDCRTMNLTYYNNTLYTVHGLEIGGRAGFRAYRINANNASFSVQTRDDFGASGWDYFYPSIYHTNDGDAVVVFGRSNETTFAQVRMTGWRAGQPELESSALVKQGSAAYLLLDDRNRNRWGDYFAAALDPWDRKTVWTIGMFPATSNSWSTWIAEVNYKPTTHFVIGTIDVPFGATVNLPVTLRRDDNLQPISGERVEFTLGSNQFLGFSFTNSSGVATIPYTAPTVQAQTLFSLKAQSFPGFVYNGTEGFGAVRLVPANITFSIPTVYGNVGQTVTLSGTLRRVTDEAVLPNRTVHFSVGSEFVGTAVTNANGVASINWVVSDGAPGATNLSLRFPGDSMHLEGTVNGTLYRKASITLNLSSAVGARGQTATLQAQARYRHNNQFASNLRIFFQVGGRSVGSAVTNSLGIARLDFTVPVDLECGGNPTEARFNGSNTVNAATDRSVFTVLGDTRADINDDLVVDDADLLIVLFNFGTRNRIADLNGDRIVDDQDLLIVLFNFGCTTGTIR